MEDVVGQLRNIKKTFQEEELQIEQLRQNLEDLKDRHAQEIKSLADKMHLTTFDEEQFKTFLDEPYVLVPTGKQEEWYVAAPKFSRMNLGWLDYTTKTYNVFRITKFIDWIGEIPEAIREKFKFKPKLPLKVFDGMLLTGEENQDQAWIRYKPFLQQRVGSQKIRIKRGYEFKLIAQLIDDGILPFMKQPVEKEDLRDPSVSFELRDYQQDARDLFLKTGAVGVFWSYSAGKTFLGMHECAEIIGPKLIVVPTVTLVEQWRDRLKEYTKCSNEVEIVTYHAFHKIQKKEYALAIFDECLTGDTLIAMSDGSVKEIKDIKNNEEVVGGSVSDKFSKVSGEIIKLRTSFSELCLTPTHPQIALERRRDKHEKKWHKLDEMDIRIKKASELRVGDCILVPEKIPHSVKTSYTPEQLDFVALIACDGHIEKDKHKNVIKVCVRKDGEKEWVRPVFIDGINAFGHHKFWEFENSRGDYVIGCSSASIVRILKDEFGIPAGRKSDTIDITNNVFYSPLESIKSFIDVCFSSEGWFFREKNGSMRMHFASTSKKFTTKLQLLLKKFGIHTHYTVKYRTGVHNTVYQIAVGGEDFNSLMDMMSFSRDSLNIPQRNTGKFMNNKIDGCRLARITKIERVNESHTVYDFTSNGANTFIANGILTHNCHHLPANMFSKFSTIKAKYRIGLSGSPYREDGRTDYIFALTGFPIGLSWDNLIELGIIEKPDIRLYIFGAWQDKETKLAELLALDKRTLVFCDRIDIGKRLSKRFEVPFVYGETKDRLEVIKSADTVIISRVGDEGLSLPDIERIIEFDFLYGSRRQESQRMGRLFHSEAKGEHIILMTESEYQRYSKRLYSIYEKGFKIEIVR